MIFKHLSIPGEGGLCFNTENNEREGVPAKAGMDSSRPGRMGMGTGVARGPSQVAVTDRLTSAIQTVKLWPTELPRLAVGSSLFSKRLPDGFLQTRDVQI